MPIPEADMFVRSFMRDGVYQSLRKWIVSNELQPGEQLRDKELAEKLGVSRTPVRESLRRLEDEGFVETSANRWTRVSLVTSKEARDIYPILKQLEQLALTLSFPNLTAQHIQTMVELHDQLRHAIRAGNAAQTFLIDSAFHQA